MAKSGISPIKGYECKRCGAQMIGVSKKKALEHYSIPMDDPLPIDLVLPYTGEIACIINGKGNLVQQGPPISVHAYSQPVLLYSFTTKSLVHKTIPARLNSRRTKLSLNEGTLSFLSEEKYKEVKNHFKDLKDSARRTIDFKRTIPCLEKALEP